MERAPKKLSTIKFGRINTVSRWIATAAVCAAAGTGTFYEASAMQQRANYAHWQTTLFADRQSWATTPPLGTDLLCVLGTVEIAGFVVCLGAAGQSIAERVGRRGGVGLV